MQLLYNDDIGKLILRVSLAILMLFHGVAKIIYPESLSHIADGLAQLGLPGFVSYGVYVGEVVAPLLVLIGIYTRLSALVVAFNMFAAIIIAHGHEIFSLTQFGGWAIELQVSLLCSAVAVAFLGSGRFAIKAD
jgi:putative oxidoreductase